MVQFLFTNKDMESLKGLYRIMTNGFVSVQESAFSPRPRAPEAPSGLRQTSVRLPTAQQTLNSFYL